MASNPLSRVEEIIQATTNKEDYNKRPLSRVEEDLLELKAAIDSGGGGGTTDYNALSNKPSINGVELEGNMGSEDIGVEPDMNYYYDPESESITLR